MDQQVKEVAASLRATGQVKQSEGTFRILYVVGNLTRFDVTPIHIHNRIRSLRHIIAEPLVVGVIAWRDYIHAGKKAFVRNKFAEIGAKVKFVPRLHLIGSLFVAFQARVGRVDGIHVVGYNAGIVGLLVRILGRPKMVFESHGAIPEEMVARGLWRASGFAYRIAKVIERRLFRAPDEVIVVSREYEKYVTSAFGCTSVSVAPCVARIPPPTSEKERETLRESLGVSDRLVVAYNGTFFTDWADPEEYMRLLADIRNAEHNPFFLVITLDDTERVIGFCSSHGMARANVKVLHLPHEQVARFLAAADVGMLLRKDSFVNRVASPMKFPEYLASGVPVIASEHVGDVSGVVEQERIGCVYRPQSETRSADLDRFLRLEVLQPGAGIRVRCRAFAEREYSYESQVPIYRDVYRRLVRSTQDRRHE